MAIMEVMMAMVVVAVTVQEVVVVVEVLVDLEAVPKEVVCHFPHIRLLECCKKNVQIGFKITKNGQNYRILIISICSKFFNIVRLL